MFILTLYLTEWRTFEGDRQDKLFYAFYTDNHLKNVLCEILSDSLGVKALGRTPQNSGRLPSGGCEDGVQEYVAVVEWVTNTDRWEPPT